MLYCTKCGEAFSEDSAFCTNCGSPRKVREKNPHDAAAYAPTGHSAPGGYGTPPYGTPPYGTPPYGTPPYGTPPYGTPHTPPYGTPPYGTSYAPPYYEHLIYSTENASRLRSLMAQLQPMLLVSIIATAIGMLMTVIMTMFIGDEEAIPSLLISLGLPSLLLAGLMIIYSQGSSSGRFSTAGFGMLKAVSVIMCIGMFMCAFVVQILLLAGSQESLKLIRKTIGYQYDLDFFKSDSHFTMVMVGLLVVFILFAIMFISIASSCSSFGRYLRGGRPPFVTGFVTGMLWIIGVLYVLASFASFSLFEAFPEYSLCSFTSYICNACNCIVGAVICAKIRQGLFHR